MKPNARIRIVPSDRLRAILVGEVEGRVVRVAPERLGVVVIEFDENHVFRLKVEEVKV